MEHKQKSTGPMEYLCQHGNGGHDFRKDGFRFTAESDDRALEAAEREIRARNRPGERVISIIKLDYGGPDWLKRVFEEVAQDKPTTEDKQEGANKDVADWERRWDEALYFLSQDGYGGEWRESKSKELKQLAAEMPRVSDPKEGEISMSFRVSGNVYAKKTRIGDRAIDHLVGACRATLRNLGLLGVQ